MTPKLNLWMIMQHPHCKHLLAIYKLILQYPLYHSANALSPVLNDVLGLYPKSSSNGVVSA